MIHNISIAIQNVQDTLTRTVMVAHMFNPISIWKTEAQGLQVGNQPGQLSDIVRS